MKYTIILEEAEEGGYTASVSTLPGCISEGDTYEEAVENIKDAIMLYLRAVAKEVELLGRQRTFKIAEVTV